MFALAEYERCQAQQYAAWCMARFFGQQCCQEPPADQGILAEKLGVFVSFAADDKILYAAGIFLPELALAENMRMTYQKGAAILQKGADALSAAVKIVSAPQLCEKIDHIDLGRHGVILFSRGRSHYLLPGAASKHGLSKVGVLEHLCHCLFLPPGTWRDKTARIMTFETVDI